MYGHINPPRHCPFGKDRKIHDAAKEALLNYTAEYLFLYQDELVRFLEEEWDIQTTKTTVARLLKADRQSKKKGSRNGPRSDMLRADWQTFMLDVTAEQLVFLDESLFKAQTGWRCMAYSPIGSEARW